MVTRIFNITNIKTIYNHQNKSGNKKKIESELICYSERKKKTFA